MTSARTFLVLAFVLPLAAGCGRTAPFNELDKSQITVMRLQQDAPPPMAGAQQGQLPMIPGIPPELQAMGQQAMQGLQQILPPGLIPPGLIPGMGAPAQPNNAQLPRFKNFVVLASMPLADEDARDELLDVFGHESSFTSDHQQCFTPGLGVTMTRTNQPPVDLLISLSCNQAMGDGFKWPYSVNGFTPDAHNRLAKIYEKLWGPVPPGA